jgi:hypothetical protein
MEGVMKRVLFVVSMIAVDSVCNGMNELDISAVASSLVNIQIRLQSKLPLDQLRVLVNHEEMRVCEERLREMCSEWLACLTMQSNDFVKQIADAVSIVPKDEKMRTKMAEIMQQLVAKYRLASDLEKELLKQAPDFGFCLGIAGCYLPMESCSPELIDLFKDFSGEDISQDAGMKLIRLSPGENAYWFLQEQQR